MYMHIYMYVHTSIDMGVLAFLAIFTMPFRKLTSIPNMEYKKCNVVILVENVSCIYMCIYLDFFKAHFINISKALRKITVTFNSLTLMTHFVRIFYDPVFLKMKK